MTWHCPDWWREARSHVSNIDPNGVSADDLYAEYACNRFSSSVSVTVDREDDRIDEGETDSAYCYEHDREAQWDSGYNLADDLSNINSISFCEDCDLWFDPDDFSEHRETEHDEHEEDEEDEDDTPAHFGSLRSLWTYATP